MTINLNKININMKKLKQILLLLFMAGTVTTVMGQGSTTDIGKLITSYSNVNDGSIGLRDVTFDLCENGTGSQIFYIFEDQNTSYTLTEVNRSSTLNVTFYFALNPAAGPFTNTGFTNLRTSCGAGPHWHNTTTVSATGDGTARYALTNNRNSSTTYINIVVTPVDVYATWVSDQVRGLTKNYLNGQSVDQIDLPATMQSKTSINWSATAKSGGSNVALPTGFSIANPTSANAYIPAFTAQNDYPDPLVITVAARLVGCPDNRTATANFTLVIDNNTITDPYFKASSSLLYKAICGTGGFGNITLSASNADGNVPSATYEISYVNGDNILDLAATQKITGTTWNPTATKTGKGVYQITPRLGNTVGVPVLITLESVAPLAASMLNITGNLTYSNGDMVPTIQLASSLPQGTQLTWAAASGATIGMQTSGNSTIPTFKAINTGSTTLSSPINYSLAYINGSCASINGSFNVLVQPKVINDPSLTAISDKASQTVCEGENFTAIKLNAAYHYDNEGTLLDNNTVTYNIKFKSGKNMISDNGKLASATWTPTITGSGTGYYEITPVHNQNQGLPVTIQLTVLPKLDANKLLNIKGTLVYENGDIVPPINLLSNLPSGVQVTWTADANAMAIGMAATTGSGVISSFRATNVTPATITTTISYTLAYIDENCDFSSASGTFSIAIVPKTIYSEDLTVSASPNGQTVCNTFEEIDLQANYQDNSVDASFIVEFLSGDNIIENIGLVGTVWVPLANKPGKGIYKITPFYNSMKGVAVIIELELLPEINLLDINYAGEALVYMNGERVNELIFKGLPDDIILDWIAPNGASIGSPISGKMSIPSFIASNNTDEPISATYTLSNKTSLYYCNNEDEQEVTFTVTVYPTPAIAGLVNQHYCHNTAIDIILPDPATSDFYRLDFVSGTDFGLTLEDDGVTITGTAINSTNGNLSGVYAVTAFNKNTLASGQVSYFVVTICPIPAINDPKDIITVNGAVVPSFQFTGNPNGGTYQWELISRTDNSTEYNMPVKGEGNTFPAFVAENHNDASIVYTYSVVALTGTDRVAPCVSDPATTFTITIHPTPTIAGLETQKYCHNTAMNITLPAPATTDFYRLDFVSGRDLGLTLESDGVTITGTAINTTNDALSGIYAVSSFNKSTLAPGKVSYFVVTVYPELKATDIIVENRTYYNGEQIPAICLSGLIENASYKWKLIDNNIGSDTTGINCIPSFFTVNMTDKPIVATYEADMLLGHCTSSDTKTFTITVNPSILDTKNLYATVDVVSQTVCFENSFAPVQLMLHHRLENINTDDVVFEWTLQGDDVLGLGTHGRLVSSDSNIYIWDIATLSAVTGTGVYTVTPIWKNFIGTPVSFTLTRESLPKMHKIQDITVCHNSPLSVEFKGMATTYHWSVKEGSKLGIPDTGTGTGMTVGHLIHNEKTVITDIINVVPINKNGCIGDSIAFKVTVLPNTSVNQVPSILKGFGENVDEIIFTGIATEYRWSSSNPMIATTPLTITNGTGNFPAFITTVMGDKPEVNIITVTPVYTYENFECTGTPMHFSMIVAPMPTIEHISDIEVCEGEKILAVNFNKLNTNANYKIAYEFSEHIGLANDTNAVAIPSFIAIYSGNGTDKQEVTVTVTPRLEIGETKFIGKPIRFKISVYPNLVLEEKEPVELNLCKGSSTELNVLILKGYNPSIQWFKNGIAIPGVDAKKTSFIATEAGIYYAIVSGRCGDAVGPTYIINQTFDVITQRWNDVLVVNMDPETNGGYTFTDIEWYKADSDAVLGNLSYLGYVNIGETYYIKANGQSFVSCEYTVIDRTQATEISAYPNPVKGGEIIKVTGASGKIYITNMNGLLIDAVDANGETTEIRMPKNVGLYVISTNHNGERKSVNVIVF